MKAQMEESDELVLDLRDVQDEKGSPLVTIGVPVYNGESYIEATLDSALAQHHDHLEILVADNASTDATAEIVRRYAANDSRVRLIENDTNIGAAPNYNLVLNEAKAEFFCWLSADDLIEPAYVERAVEILIERPDVVGVYSHAGRINEHGERIGDYHDTMAALRLSSPDAGIRFRDSVLGFPAIVLFGVMRRSAMLDSPGHGAYIGGDRVFVSEMALKGKIVRVEEELFQRRVHAEAYSSILDKKAKAKWFGGDDAVAGSPNIERIKHHLAALDRSGESLGVKLRGRYTMFVRFPMVLAKTQAFNCMQRALRIFGRQVDRGRWAS